MPEIRPFLGPGVEVVEAGVLDNLTEEEIAGLAPGPGDSVLVSRLRDGREVKLRHQDVVDRMQGVLDLVAPGAEAVLLLCTGSFPRLEASCPILYPEHILSNVARAVLAGYDRAHVGVLTPGEEQVNEQRERWTQVLGASGLTVLPVSPYHDVEPQTRAGHGAGVAERPGMEYTTIPDPVARRMAVAGRQLREAGVQIAIMDCLGYTAGMKQALREAFGGPVLLARTVLARVAGELLSADGCQGHAGVTFR